MKKSDIDKLAKARELIYEIDITEQDIKSIDELIKDCDNNPDTVYLRISSCNGFVNIELNNNNKEFVLSTAEKIKEDIKNKLNDLNKKFEEL